MRGAGWTGKQTLTTLSGQRYVAYSCGVILVGIVRNCRK